MNKYLELGQIVNVKGLKGEIKVNPFTDDATKFEKIKSIVVKSKNQNTEYVRKNDALGVCLASLHKIQ